MFSFRSGLARPASICVRQTKACLQRILSTQKELREVTILKKSSHLTSTFRGFLIVAATHREHSDRDVALLTNRKFAHHSSYVDDPFGLLGACRAYLWKPRNELVGTSHIVKNQFLSSPICSQKNRPALELVRGHSCYVFPVNIFLFLYSSYFFVQQGAVIIVPIISAPGIAWPAKHPLQHLSAKCLKLLFGEHRSRTHVIK